MLVRVSVPSTSHTRSRQVKRESSKKLHQNTVEPLTVECSLVHRLPVANPVVLPAGPYALDHEPITIKSIPVKACVANETPHPKPQRLLISKKGI